MFSSRFFASMMLFLLLSVSVVVQIIDYTCLDIDKFPPCYPALVRQTLKIAYCGHKRPTAARSFPA